MAEFLKTTSGVFREKDKMESRSLISVPKFNVDTSFWATETQDDRNYILNLLRKTFHAKDGICFVGSIERMIVEEMSIKVPWVGIINQVPSHKQPNPPNLERLLKTEIWHKNLVFCKGIYVLSKYVKEFLIAKDVDVPISQIYHPIKPIISGSETKKTTAKNGKGRLLYIDTIQSQEKIFSKLTASGYEKKYIKLENWNKIKLISHNGSQADICLNEAELHQLIIKSVVFMNLTDAVINRTVIDCIATNSPLLINRLPAVVDYLGSDYPLFYTDLEEAEAKLENFSLIHKTIRYLRQYPIKHLLTEYALIKAIEHSAIYRDLPTPLSQKTEFQEYDVSVIIPLNAQAKKLESLLDALRKQEFDGKIEIVVWNNYFPQNQTLNEIYARFKDKISLKLIHASEALSNQIWVAIPSLIRSDLLLFLNENEVPSPTFISRILQKYNQYGKNFVLCCSGYELQPHELNEENPEFFWKHREKIKFFNEKSEDREIHIFNSKHCLVPKKIVKKAIKICLETNKAINDYLLSFVFSHDLNVRTIKINVSEYLKSKEKSVHVCAKTPLEEMSLDQLTSFYIYHMRKRWPSF